MWFYPLCRIILLNYKASNSSPNAYVRFYVRFPLTYYYNTFLGNSSNNIHKGTINILYVLLSNVSIITYNLAFSFSILYIIISMLVCQQDLSISYLCNIPRVHWFKALHTLNFSIYYLTIQNSYAWILHQLAGSLSTPKPYIISKDVYDNWEH